MNGPLTNFLRFALTGLLNTGFGYASYAVLVLTGYFSPIMLVVFLALYTLKTVWGIYKAPKPAGPPASYPENTLPLWFSATAFYHNRSYGLFLLIGLVLSLFIR